MRFIGRYGSMPGGKLFAEGAAPANWGGLRGRLLFLWTMSCPACVSGWELSGVRFGGTIMHAVEEELSCTLLRVPPLARWAVRKRVRTSGLFRPHAMPSVAHAALGTSCSVECEPAARCGKCEPPALALPRLHRRSRLAGKLSSGVWGVCACPHMNL